MDSQNKLISNFIILELVKKKWRLYSFTLSLKVELLYQTKKLVEKKNTSLIREILIKLNKIGY